MNESQGCVAKMLSVSTETITSWELNHHEPQVHFHPRIIEYLGYCPLFDLAENSQSKRLNQDMFMKGLTQKDYANQLGIDTQVLKKITSS